MIQASFRRAQARSASRRGSDILIPSGACWPGVTTANVALGAIRTPAATSIPSSTGTAVTAIPARSSAVRLSGKPGSSIRPASNLSQSPILTLGIGVKLLNADLARTRW